MKPLFSRHIQQYVKGIVTAIVVASCLTRVAVAQEQNPVRGVSDCNLWEATADCSEGDFIEVNGIQLYYEVHGEGEPLLLIHGGASLAENFNLMLPELARHFKVILPDTRAHGRSSDSDSALSYQLIANDMAKLLDALAIESAYVGGWSDGSSYAINMAIYHPSRVRALVLTPVDLTASGLSDTFWEEMKDVEFPQKISDFWKTREAPTPDQLSKIKAPAVMIVGRNEQYVQLEHVKWQSDLIPNTKVVWLEGCDHFCVTQKPDEVNKVILDFLSQLEN